MQRRGAIGDIIYVVFHIEDRGGMITEERSDMMMMMVVPTKILTARNTSSLWIFFTLYD